MLSWRQLTFSKTFWQNGDALVQTVAANNNNTILIIHSVGPVLLANYSSNPNITAILWAGVPGEQSGNSVADVLYGRVNPGARLPFTIAGRREDYSTDVMYDPNHVVPQQDFTEGVFIDYRGVDKSGVTPTYEFGFGLSYTTFNYSDIKVTKLNVGPYVPTSGLTAAAPTYGSGPGNDLSSYLFPSNLTRVPYYIYPYLNSSDLQTSYHGPDYALPGFIPPGSQDGSPQPLLAAGGAPGGNPQLYDVLYTVTATVTNTGKVAGEEVPQLVSLSVFVSALVPLTVDSTLHSGDPLIPRLFFGDSKDCPSNPAVRPPLPPI